MFERWLRWANGHVVPLLDELLWRMIRRRWALLLGGVPGKQTLTMISTAVARYG